MNNETKQHQRWKVSSWASSLFLNQPKLTVNNSDDPKFTTNEPTNYDPTTIPKKKLKLIVDNDHRFHEQHNIEDEESGFGTIYVTGNHIDNDDIRLPAPLPIKKSFGQRFNDYIDDASTIATIQTISHHHPRDIVNTPKRIIRRNNNFNEISPLSLNSKVFRDRTNVVSESDGNDNIKTMTMTETIIEQSQEEFTYSDSSFKQNNDNNNNIEILNATINSNANNNNNIIENTDVVINNEEEVNNFNKKQHSSFHCCFTSLLFFDGINQDLKYCLPSYKSDWILKKFSSQDIINDCNHDNIIISNKPHHDNNVLLIRMISWKGFCITIHQFIIHFMICITFSQLLYEQTSGTMGLVEILISSCIIGILFSIMKGNDFNHLHTINGPITIWIGTIYNGLYLSISKEEDVNNINSNFFSLFFWICIWSSIFHIICSMMRYSTIIQTSITSFTTNILQSFIGISFIYLSLYQLLQPLHILYYDNSNINSNIITVNTSSPQEKNSNDLSLEYASLLLGIITMYLCWSFHYANQWNYLTKSLRIFLSSYNTLLSCIIVTSISFLPGINQKSSDYDDSSSGIDRLSSIQAIPWDWSPTYNRSWIIRPLSSSMNQTTIGIAIVPGFILFILLHLINNNNNSVQSSTEITGHITTCRRKPTHHWDTFVSGMALLPCAFLGLPPSTGNNDSFQNSMMKRPLSTEHQQKQEDEMIQRRSTIQNENNVLEETRWIGIVYSMFMFIGLFTFRILAWIPQGCINGLLLYYGVVLVSDNSIWEHLKLCFMTSKARLRYQQSSSLQISKILENVPLKAMQLYTLIQVVLMLLIFVMMQFSTIGYLYPILIISLIPIRQYILLKFFFTKEDLNYLDPKQPSYEPPQLQDQKEPIEEDQEEEQNDDDATTASHQLYFFDANQSHDVATLCPSSETSSHARTSNNDDNNFSLYHQKHPLHPPANLFEKHPITPRLQHSVRSSGIKKQKEVKGTSRPNNNQCDLNSILSLTQTKLSSILVGNLAVSNNAAAYYSDDNGSVNSASMWSQSNVE